VYEVETRFRECPRLAEIVDLEFQIRRDVAGLDGREIGRYDGRRRELVCEINGPDSRARSYVEHALREGTYGREEKLALKGQRKDVVEEIEVILGRFVIRTPIFDPSVRSYKNIFGYLSERL
jgi:hypothetical protein